MTQPALDTFTIDLDVLRGEDDSRPVAAGSRIGRGLVATVVALACLLTLVGSAGRSRLGEPIWTGQVNGNRDFALGFHSLTLPTPDGQEVVSWDLDNGLPRWRFAITNTNDAVSTMDLGGGVTAVSVQQSVVDATTGTVVAVDPTTGTAVLESGRRNSVITFLKDATGEQIGRTTGYLVGTSAPGQLVVVMEDRPRGAAGCAGPQTTCQDITGWDVSGRTATVAWRVSLPPTSFGALTNTAADGLLELGPDGAVRLRELTSGAVVGAATWSAQDQVFLLRDVMVTVRRDSSHITLTAFRRPALKQAWTVRLPSAVVGDLATGGYVQLGDCGRTICMNVDGNSTQFIDLATGSSSPPLPAEVVARLDDDTFLAASGPNSPVSKADLFVVTEAGEVVQRIADTSLVWWFDAGERAMVSREGADHTWLSVIDGDGRAHDIGGVTGTHLNCVARADLLACADANGRLRVWRLPPL